jgi:hypothetical protein
VFDRVSVNVSQLCHKSGVIAHVVIKVARLPERVLTGDPFVRFSSLNGDFGFQQLHGFGQRRVVRLAHQDVDVLGHDYVAVNAHLKASTHLIQRREERVLHMHPRQQGLAVKTAEREEMRLSGMVKSTRPSGIRNLQ